MNQPKQTISKTETVETTEQAAESYFQKYKYIGGSAIKPAFIDGASWKEQHSYSEQEVIDICKQLLVFAEFYRDEPFPLEAINFDDLLIKK